MEGGEGEFLHDAGVFALGDSGVEACGFVFGIGGDRGVVPVPLFEICEVTTLEQGGGFGGGAGLAFGHEEEGVFDRQALGEIGIVAEDVV